MRPGIPSEELRSQLGLDTAFFNELVNWAESEGMLIRTGPIMHLPDHTITFNSEQEKAVEGLMERFDIAGVNSPSVKECKEEVSEEVYTALIDLDRLRQISDDVVYTTPGYEDLVSQIVDYLNGHERIDAAQLRDLLGTSRKYAIALLEHLDDIRITRRVGDSRELYPDRL